MADIRSVTQLKVRSSDLVDRVNTTRSPIIITQRGEARAVLQDLESYERTQRSLAMLQLVLESEESVRRHGALPHETVASRFRRRRRP